jgi:hypothetical protein
MLTWSELVAITFESPKLNMFTMNYFSAFCYCSIKGLVASLAIIQLCFIGVNVFAQSNTKSDFNNLTWTISSTVDKLPSMKFLVINELLRNLRNKNILSL